MARNVGSAAKGSTRKKMELSASSEKRASAELSMRVSATGCGANIRGDSDCCTAMQRGWRPPRKQSNFRSCGQNRIIKTQSKETRIPLETTANICHNGELIPWEKAQIHVMSHVVHY